MLTDGMPAIEVINQAVHSSIEQTNEYAIYAIPTGREKINNKAADFWVYKKPSC